MAALDKAHTGAWSGTWRTFLTPDDLFDHSPLSGTISIEGEATVFEYHGSIGDDDVRGRMRWSTDGSIDWIDSWHTAGEEAHLVGSPPSYDYGDGHGGTWTWDIDVDTDADSITITHSNTGPGIPRYTGVVMELTRPR